MIPGLPADVTLRLVHGDEELPAWESWLTDTELACMHSFGSLERRKSFIRGRAAARLAASAALSRSAEAVSIDVTESGAVALEGEDAYLSIAHAGSFAIAGVYHRPIGVDLEIERPVHPRLFDRIASPADQAVLNKLGLPNVELACWTLKEAVLKGLGTGLRLAPNRLSIVRSEDCFEIRTPEHGTWRAALQVLDRRYVSVAWLPSDS